MMGRAKYKTGSRAEKIFWPQAVVCGPTNLVENVSKMIQSSFPQKTLNHFYVTRKSCIFLQNRLLLIYCSSVYKQFFQLHCCFYKASTASQKLLLLQQCFTCITVSMKPLLLLGNFNCLKDVPNFNCIALKVTGNGKFGKIT